MGLFIKMNSRQEERLTSPAWKLKVLLETNILLLLGKHELFDIIWGKNTIKKIVALVRFEGWMRPQVNKFMLSGVQKLFLCLSAKSRALNSQLTMKYCWKGQIQTAKIILSPKLYYWQNITISLLSEIVF